MNKIYYGDLSRMIEINDALYFFKPRQLFKIMV